jgi:hypothetical protein
VTGTRQVLRHEDVTLAVELADLTVDPKISQDRLGRQLSVVDQNGMERVPEGGLYSCGDVYDAGSDLVKIPLETLLVVGCHCGAALISCR